jgi:maleate isomerase
MTTAAPVTAPGTGPNTGQETGSLIGPGPRAAALVTPRARLGLIIPSSNRLAEPQMRHYAPAGLGVHVTRLRMTGPWHKPISKLHDEIRQAAGALADSHCDAIVFHCTGGAMEEGPDTEAEVVDLIAQETGALALTPGTAVVAALKALMIQSLVLLTPYRQAVNDAERIYLNTLGVEVVEDIALKLSGGDEYITVEPVRWLDLSIEAMNRHPQADGLFLSCTNTTQIEIVAAAERAIGRPCVNSNQAVMWQACRLLAPKLGGFPRDSRLGRLFGNP